MATQVVAASNLQYEWTATSTAAAGPLGAVVAFSNANVKRPLYNSFQAAISGTAPSVCTFQAEVSLDRINWLPLPTVDDTGNAQTNPIDATAGAFGATGVNFIAPFTFLRINLVAFTAGDPTTVVKFYWAGAGQ